jgi:hypothetical protein
VDIKGRYRPMRGFKCSHDQSTGSAEDTMRRVAFSAAVNTSRFSPTAEGSTSFAAQPPS